MQLSPNQFITVVAGYPRSGTSMMMRILEAGGLDGLDPGFVTWAREQLLTHRGSSLPLSSNLVRIWEADGLRGKLANSLKFTFPSREAMATMYPASPSSRRIYLYCPIRLTDVLLRYGRTAWQLLRRDEAAPSRRPGERTAAMPWWIGWGPPECRPGTGRIVLRQ